jgi:hypothetical protein
MTPEGKIEAHLKKRVGQLGGEIRKLSWIGRRGAPDRMIWWPGPVMAFVEVKAPGGRISTLQQREMDRLAEAGFTVAVVWDEEGIDELLFMLTSVVGGVQ